MNHLKFHKFLFFLILSAFFFLPTAATAESSERLGWLYERIDLYKAIENNKKRIQNSKSEAEKKSARKLLLKSYAEAIDAAEGERREKLIIEANADLPDWWIPNFLLAIMKYEKFKDALLHFDNKQADLLIKEAFDFAAIAKEKNGIPKKFRSTCNMIIRNYQRTKPFTVHGIAHNVRPNSLDLKGDNRKYLIESIPDKFIGQGLIKEGDIIKVAVKPKVALGAGSYGSHDLMIGGFQFLALKYRMKPGYILSGQIIRKKAGAFIVNSDNRKKIITDISEADYDFFNVGDTIKCRVYQNTRSYRSSRHLRLYEIDPASFQMAMSERKKSRMNAPLPQRSESLRPHAEMPHPAR